MISFDWEKKIIKESGSVAGVDEAGRGALAGPVVVAMVILNPKNISTKINDSKQVSPADREDLAREIKQVSMGYSISIISQKTIDKINILQATKKGVRECFTRIYPHPDHLLLDALRIPDLDIAQTPLIKGDEISYSIAAASILAKTTRDTLMVEISRQYPEYGFESHKGYGVKSHLKALREYGATSVHRKTFAPVRELEELTLFT